MTAFEITIIVLLAAIVVLLIVLLRTAIEGFHGVWQNQDVIHQDIQRIEVNTHHASSVLQDKIIPEIERILSDILVLKAYFNGLLERLDKMTDEGGTLQQQLNDLAINSKGHYNELQQLREEIYNKRLLFELGTKSSPPCYASNGICTNPQMDCINCPKRGTGGTWSTSTNTIKEGEQDGM